MVGVTPGLRKIYLLSVTLFMLAGWTALGVGAYFISTPFMRREAVLTHTPIWVAIGIGISMSVSSIIGFIVAFSRHKARTKIAVFIALISLVLVATLCLGAYVWFQTLNVRSQYSARWQEWSDILKEAFQSNDKCCGYQSTIDSPAFSDTCTKDIVYNGLLSPCEDKILQYVNTYLRNIYTTLFLYTAVDVLTMLAALMLDQTLKDQFRYEKSVAKMINLHNISMCQDQYQVSEPQMQMRRQNHISVTAPRRSLLPNSSMHNYSVIHGQHQ